MMNFEEKINNFIDYLKNYDMSKFGKSSTIFNPWIEQDKTDIDNAAEIRCQNLKKFLLSQKNAKVILIAESPSTGARYTGIPMTSEKTIKEYEYLSNIKLNYSSKNNKKYKRGERTANTVWKEISKTNKYDSFVFWNAFPFNFHEKEKSWFRTPTKIELNISKDILEEFCKLYPNAQIISLGQSAQKALNSIDKNNFKAIRHPSNDYKNEFLDELNDAINSI